MRHLIVSRELPPAAYTVGGIGTYVASISRLLAEAGEIVHVLGERWRGAPDEKVVELDGRLTTHRVRRDEPLVLPGRSSTWDELWLLQGSPFQAQAWGWNAALFIEYLVEREQVDVIEAQEWEAPLYYFLLRRASGLGPSRQPPVIIQLHSPSEYIWRSNKWSVARPDFLPMRRQEEFCIQTADALLCPSHYLAREAERRYGLSAESVSVIPIPIGQFVTRPRNAPGAANGPVVYVGRLEPRKGPIEFVEAALLVAGEYPEAHFEFLGDDIHYRDHLTVRRYLEARIPPALRPRFRFRGVVTRETVAETLATAAFAVVPSRWENFPNSCVEAMAAGVPVMASPNGGMAEMIDDGVSGWIARSQHPGDLAAALRRALSTPPAEREVMGRTAATSIRARCGAETIVNAQVRFRARVMATGTVNSNRLPGMSRTASVPVTTAVASTRPVERLELNGQGTIASAIRLATASEAVGFAIVQDHLEVERPALDLAAGILLRHDEVGLIAGWIAGNPSLSAQAPAAFPFQWLANDAKGVVVFRRQALEQIVDDQGPGSGDPLWDLVNAVLAAGWKSAVIPVFLGRRPVKTGRNRRMPDDGALAEPTDQLRHFRDKYPARFEQDRELQALLLDIGVSAAGQIQRNSTGGWRDAASDRWRNLTPSEFWRLSMPDTFALLGAAIRDRRRTIAWLRTHFLAQPAARTRRKSSGTT